MEPLFENCYTRTPAMLKELYRRYYITRPLYIVGDIFAVACILLNLVTLILFRRIQFIGIVSALLLFFIQAVSYFSVYKTTINRDLEINQGQPMECKMTVTETGIQSVESSGETVNIEFSAIRKVLKTQHLILLHTQANLIHIFPKDSFTVGTQEDFVRFLQTKGLKIK